MGSATSLLKPGQRAVVFTRRATLQALSAALDAEGIPHASFHGGMSGPEKDSWRPSPVGVEVLLSRERARARAREARLPVQNRSLHLLTALAQPRHVAGPHAVAGEPGTRSARQRSATQAMPSSGVSLRAPGEVTETADAGVTWRARPQRAQGHVEGGDEQPHRPCRAGRRTCHLRVPRTRAPRPGRRWRGRGLRTGWRGRGPPVRRRWAPPGRRVESERAERRMPSPASASVSGLARTDR